MGVVFRARQISLNRTVALKLISAGELASQALVQRFHLEAEAAAGLHHPNIVPIYETGEVKGQHFFSMELIEGVALDKRITKVGFAEPGDAGEAQPLSRDRQAVRDPLPDAHGPSSLPGRHSPGNPPKSGRRGTAASDHAGRNGGPRSGDYLHEVPRHLTPEFTVSLLPSMPVPVGSR